MLFMHKYEWKLGKNYVSFFQLNVVVKISLLLFFCKTAGFECRNYVKILKIDK